MARTLISTTLLVAAFLGALPGCDSKNDAKGASSSAPAKPSAPATPSSTAAAPATPPARPSAPAASAAPPASAAPSNAVVVDAPPAASGGAAPTAAAAIQNATDIGRYPDESKLDAPATIKAQIGDVQNAADSSNDGIIATLVQGTPVRKIASHGGYYLVVYQDPSETAPRALEGWITTATLDDTPPPSQPAPTLAPPPAACAAGTIQFASGSGVLCLQECTSNQQCSAGMKCEGDGWRVRDGHARDHARYCVKRHDDRRDDRRNRRDERHDEHYQPHR